MLTEAADAALRAYGNALATMSAEDRRSTVGPGADGTETYLLDEVVEAPVLDVLEHHGVNVLSEEIGWIDRASSVTVVIDPVDGTANAAAGVPLSAFAGALVVDEVVREALVVWLDTGRRWSAVAGEPAGSIVSGRTGLDGASLSMLRPRPENRDAWMRIADRTSRIRVLGSSVLEAMLVADGAVDAFCDPGGDVHRIVDIAAAALVVESAGGCVVDAYGRPFSFGPDLSLRWSGVFAASASLADEIVTAITS
ncbi:inositol monophosphatase family protein [Ilumatobacter sp.]|uniref:inositol monophosphatase family protein n=1 Tax=Ilumatobacter sp. TaxID=1967498 RepID=UPI003C447C57